jgi:hypothetical protein
MGVAVENDGLPEEKGSLECKQNGERAKNDILH